MNHVEVIQLQNTEEAVTVFAEFLTKQSSQFAVPLIGRVDIHANAQKLLRQGYVFAATDQQGMIRGIVAGYANDMTSQRAFEALFVVDEKMRGTKVAQSLFSMQVEYCIKQGMKVLTFSTNKKNLAAVAFYQKQIGIHIADAGDELQYELIL